jgi:methionyl-tRNA formyltransferase
VALVAEEAAGARALGLVVERGHELSLVVATSSGNAPTARAAAAVGVPLAEPAIVRTPAFAERLIAARVDLLLNVHSLLIVRSDALAVPTVGSFNLHPGPLPQYAGLDTPSWAIVEGAAEFGCTVHWMDAHIDTGPIAYAASFPVSERETGLSLNARCARAGLDLLARLLDDVERAPETVPSVPQQLEARRYFHRGPPNGGAVDWTGEASSVERFVRACDFHPLPSPWAPGPRTWAGGAELRILKAHATSQRARLPPGTVESVADGIARVAAGDLVVEVTGLSVEGQPVAPNAVLQAEMVLQDQP